jgi:hypothetical protein
MLFSRVRPKKPEAQNFKRKKSFQNNFAPGLRGKYLGFFWRFGLI